MSEVKRYVTFEEARDIPEVLFDGYAVYQSMAEKAKQRTNPENVSDVLDAIVGILRGSAMKGAKP